MLSESEKQWTEQTYHRGDHYQRTSLGLYLRYARKCSHLTLQQVAKLSGVSDAAIVNIETGRSKNPRVDIALKICKALGIEGNKLMEVVTSD